MARPTRIHKDKQPRRLHYIPEWAQRRRLKQTDIAKGMDVDKSTVSRWFDGVIPVEEHLIGLSDLLEAGEPAALFRHPDDDWMSRLFREESEHKRRRAIQLLRAIMDTEAA